MRRLSTLRRIKSAAALTAGVALAIGAAAIPAAAATDDGFWYFDALNVQSAHDAGWTGEGVTIAVLDGPVNTDIPTLKNANIEVREPSFCYTEDGTAAPAISTDLSGPDSAYHGTNVVSYLSGTGDGYPGQTGVKGVAPDAKVLYYAISRLDSVVDGGEKLLCLEEDGEDLNSGEVGNAMNEAMDAGADIIVIPATYTGSALAGDSGAYSRAIREGVIVVGSVSNSDGLEVSMGFPAGANGAVGVQAADQNRTIQATDGNPNANTDTMVLAPGIGVITQGERDGGWEAQPITQGTSLAAPIEAGYIALAVQKWPDATSNQILQNLIRSSNDEGVPYFDPEGLAGFGFGSATRMLERDPAQYDDVNPLLDARPSSIPPTDELLAAPEPTVAPSATPSATPSAGSDLSQDEPSSDSGGLLVVGIVVGALLVGVVVLVILLLVRRSRRNGAGT